MIFLDDSAALAAPVGMALLGSLLAGLATGLGALPVLFMRRLTPRTEGLMLGFAAGVMLGATAFTLIPPGLAAATALYGDPQIGALAIGTGILLGAGGLFALHERTPHEHFVLGPDGAGAVAMSRHWLLVLAIAIHNLPEGLAVGVGFGAGDMGGGTTLAIGIGLQNMPEGLVVAAAMVADGHSRMRAFLFSLMTGLIEPIGGLISAVAVSAAETLLPWGYAFAAGAMLFVVSHEIIPETHRNGVQGPWTIGLLAGFVAMLYLTVAIV
jgi:ZIP family zinc transporter